MIQTQNQATLSLKVWWPLLLGSGAILFASYVRFASSLWTLPENDHAPIVVGIALFLFWTNRRVISEGQPPAQVSTAILLLVVGVVLFVFGVRTRIASFESASHVVILAGAIWLAGGTRMLRQLWFPLLFLALSIPIPAFVLSIATEGLKMHVTSWAVDVLYALGYPIAHDGAVITMGNYRLLVAEACAGMNSIISLSAVGLLYLYLVQPPRLLQLFMALAAVIPIAIAANVLRIVILSLVTYYWGDEAGQGFLHEFAGFAMFLFALLALIAFTKLLVRLPSTVSQGKVDASA